MDESELTSKPRRLSLIDVSAEDDSLIDSYAGGLVFPEELFEAGLASKLEVVPENLKLREQVSQPSESIEPEMTKKSGKYNLRKSLAWDSAFFTSAGVLDPEELSSMIEGDKSGKQILPGIQEEICRSTDSISTLESDTLTLKSVEANLFGDIRASIQKSSKAANAVDESIKVGSGVTENEISRASKGIDFASQDQMMPRLASKKPSIDVQKPGKSKRQAYRCPQVSQSVSTSGESTKSLLKQPKVLGNPNPNSAALTKRTSMGGNPVKMEKDNTKSATDRGAPMSKIPLSSRIVPRPRPLSKSPSLDSSPATKREAAFSSFNCSGSSASGNIGKSPFNSKRKTDSRTSNLPSSGSTLKIASRIEPRSKSQSGKSHLTSNMMPGTNLRSSISPASSVSEWSSDSSSTSTLKKTSYSSRASLDTSYFKSSSVDGDVPQILDLQNHAYDQTSIRHETQVTGLLQSVVKAPVEKNGALPPASKPSGLRLPSPKIGFFDGGKSAGSTPNGSKQPHPVVPSSSPKTGAGNVSLSGGQNKAKLGKLQPARTVMKLGNKKPDSQKTSLNMKSRSPVPLQQASNAATKVISPSRNSITPKVQSKVPPKSGRENHLKDVKVGTEGHGIDIDEQENCFAEMNDSLAFSKDKVSPELKGNSHVNGIKITPINEGLSSICDSSSTSDAGNIAPTDQVGEEATHELPDFKQRERSHFEDQVDGLSRQVGTMDINAETKQMPSEQVGEDATHELPDFKQRERSHFEDQVDGLCRQVGTMDINAETKQTLAGDSHSSAQFQ